MPTYLVALIVGRLEFVEAEAGLYDKPVGVGQNMPSSLK